jgi:hypothetical protein
MISQAASLQAVLRISAKRTIGNHNSNILMLKIDRAMLKWI